MSYLSGVMMGAAIGKNVHDFLTRRAAGNKVAVGIMKEPGIVLQHVLPGRRRYYVSVLRGNGELSEILQKKLSQLSFIQEVRVNQITGSLLLIYSGEEQVDALIAWLREHIFSVRKTKEAQNDAALAQSGQSIRRTVGAMNSCLKDHTQNWFDLSSLLSIFFVIRGLRKMLLFHQLPSGPQMIWWAVSLLRGWRMV